jgi:hypothetical protein
MESVNIIRQRPSFDKFKFKTISGQTEKAHASENDEKPHH